ncbi:uncharacterized protein LOC111330450 [Stylophora pistillata]|uniref:uncharacterized protein LOC111330450 n=1 Tax=Stylophora pistillata TaxID=50429 RepID=UPI000C04B15C|nr:uncharacterized protein LOC111330450 [Stylophora pistillata]
MLKGCLMKGCRNGGSCLFHEMNQTFSCSCIHPWTGDDCQIIDKNGWTLIARFSNSDSKNWMRGNGKWWYDQKTAIGATNNPSMNNDMISTGFWLVSGSEIKITGSDDPSHTPLLQTTGNCSGGQTFRSKITSYGDFRNGTVWASNQCLGSCTVQYGGQYKSTDGFQQAKCSGNIQSADKIGFWCDWDDGDGSVMMIGGGGTNCERADHGIGITERDAAAAKCSGNIQSADKIGFWCDWDDGDGSVMMIGGGGTNCERADHGIGITERDAASFVDHGSSERDYDFGYEAWAGNAVSQSYSLNLWIR